jgi:hypothetical protein
VVNARLQTRQLHSYPNSLTLLHLNGSIHGKRHFTNNGPKKYLPGGLTENISARGLFLMPPLGVELKNIFARGLFNAAVSLLAPLPGACAKLRIEKWNNHNNYIASSSVDPVLNDRCRWLE